MNIQYFFFQKNHFIQKKLSELENIEKKRQIKKTQVEKETGDVKEKRKLSELEKSLQIKKFQIEKDIDDIKQKIINSKYEKLNNIKEFRKLRNDPEKWKTFLTEYSELDFAKESNLESFAPELFEINRDQINKYFYLTSKELEKVVDVCLANKNLSDFEFFRNHYSFKFTFPSNANNLLLSVFDQIRLITNNISIVYCYVYHTFLHVSVYLQREGPSLGHKDVVNFFTKDNF